MTDLMRWMYNHYIKSQPKDDAEDMWFTFLDFELAPHQTQAFQEAVAYYAVQGFRLGVRTGVTLSGELNR